MKTLRIAAILPAIALIAACGSEAEEPTPTNDNPPALAESADEQPAGIETPEPAEGAETASTSEGAIPAQFIGVWDYIEGTCDPASDMRLEITQEDFTFYESYGEIRDVRSEGDYTIVDLAMEGEGETWSSSERLFLTESGELHLTDPAASAALTDYPRKRCDG